MKPALVHEHHRGNEHFHIRGWKPGCYYCRLCAFHLIVWLTEIYR